MKEKNTSDGTFNLQWIEVSKLHPAKYNPRKDLKPGDPEYESLKKSINEFGLVDPIVVNKDMTVIGGHQRLKVIMEAGFDKVPCSVVDLDKKHEKALNIALNKISGDWDMKILRELFIELDTGDFDIHLTGFNSHELELMMTATFQGDEQSLMAKNFNDGKGVDGGAAHEDLPPGKYPVTFIFDQEEWELWEGIKARLKLKDDKAAFLKLIGGKSNA